MDKFDEAVGVFLTFYHSVNIAIQKCFNIPSDHYVTNGSLVNNNNNNSKHILELYVNLKEIKTIVILIRTMIQIPIKTKYTSATTAKKCGFFVTCSLIELEIFPEKKGL